MSTRFLLHTTAPYLSHIVLKFGLHRSTPSSQNFAPKWPTPADFSVGDIRSQIAAAWLQIAQRSQWRAYRKTSSLFRMVPSLTSTTSPYLLPPNWEPKCTRQQILHDACYYHLANMIEDWERCRLSANYFGLFAKHLYKVSLVTASQFTSVTSII